MRKLGRCDQSSELTGRPDSHSSSFSVREVLEVAEMFEVLEVAKVAEMFEVAEECRRLLPVRTRARMTIFASFRWPDGNDGAAISRPGQGDSGPSHPGSRRLAGGPRRVPGRRRGREWIGDTLIPCRQVPGFVAVRDPTISQCVWYLPEVCDNGSLP